MAKVDMASVIGAMADIQSEIKALDENDVLLNPVTVVIGVSDGQTVEILDGISDGTLLY